MGQVVTGSTAQNAILLCIDENQLACSCAIHSGRKTFGVASVHSISYVFVKCILFFVILKASDFEYELLQRVSSASWTHY